MAQLVPIYCTSKTRPDAPCAGQFIQEKDTGKVYFYNGEEWILHNQVLEIKVDDGIWHNYADSDHTIYNFMAYFGIDQVEFEGKHGDGSPWGWVKIRKKTE